MTTPSVFISYSHDSTEHSDRVLALSDRLRADGIDATIDQYEESPAEGWPKWMDRQIAKSNFVLVVCTETFLRRVVGNEDPGKGRGVKWESTLTYQHLYNDDSLNKRFIPILFEGSTDKHIPTPLQGATYYFIPAQYDDLYRRLTNQPKTTKPELGKQKSLPPRERKSDFLGVKISLAKLPSTDSTLFGREKELAMLDAAWSGAAVILSEAKNLSTQNSETLRSAQGDNHKVNVLSLVAWGGVGKSALVNKWLSRIAAENYRGAERVFGWSFYSQGAAEGRQVSADQFIATALAWFGDADPNLGSPWDKGERLAELVKQSRTLIILDGLEPLQNPPPVETGRIKDPALVAFLRELARQNPGLVVITTRLAVDDLKDFIAKESPLNPPLPRGAGGIEIDLDNLSSETGAAYLKHLGVVGTDDELKDAGRDFGGHALALTLLGSYLSRVYHGDIRKRHEIPHLTDDQKQGAHARRVLQSYERWLKGKPELDILRLMGLFDRPAERGALDALRKKPAIPGLTDALQKLSDADWQFAVANLRDLRLLSHPERTLSEQSESKRESKGDEELDCHPLLREHFGEQLKEANPAAWREGNNRLYEYYKSAAKEFPDTIQEMAPLFAAVLHGCQAGKYQEAFWDYYKRIQRGGEINFCMSQFGAIGSELAVLSGFFASPWRKPVDGLREDMKAGILNFVGYRLRALGRLVETTQPTQASLDAAIAQKNWKNSAIAANNLSELFLTIGDVAEALVYAKQSVELADRSDDVFEQWSDRPTLADALLQAGRLAEARATFREAEEMIAKSQPQFPLLYGLAGYRYCDLLLSQWDYVHVQQQANRTLKWVTAQRWLLDIALDNLSLGRAHLLQSQHEPNHSFTESANFLNLAVNGLRQAGTMDHLPRGLLARAELHRVTGALDKAKRDLDEAFAIATRGGMGLHLADCHLEYARLHVETFKRSNVQTEIEQAREDLKTAKEMIEKMGYHRRDKEVAELEKQLQ